MPFRHRFKNHVRPLKIREESTHSLGCGKLRQQAVMASIRAALQNADSRCNAAQFSHALSVSSAGTWGGILSISQKSLKVI
jgi:hypothetical protein